MIMRQLDHLFEALLLNIKWLISKITLPFSLFIFFERELIQCYSCIIFFMKYMSICNDLVSYNK